METLVRTPQLVFMQPQRLVVPLFQRPYVWNEDNQWEPLWLDVTRLASKALKSPAEKIHPHFLGAVVLQQVNKNTGQLQERTIIDGQQRLTTMQLLLDALHCELVALNAMQPAMRIEPLVRNAEAFCSSPEDTFKVWPTNRDRPAFNAVMRASHPIDYDSVGYRGEKMVEAHRFFSSQAREWLMSEGENALSTRASALETVIRDRLQIVVIDLAAEENAQEIFETLNARGAPLSSADLIKNFIFQRLLEFGADVEKAYEQYWKEFETGFWEKDISVGRLFHPRAAIFLNHWLISRTGKEILAKEVFYQFKRFVDEQSGSNKMMDLLQKIHASAQIYRSFVDGALKLTGDVSRLELFSYRTGVLESEIVKPLLLYLLDPDETPIGEVQFVKALDVVESWMVRRMLVRATTKAYNQVFSDLISQLKKGDRANAGDVIERYFREQKTDSSYWPDDEELTREIEQLLAYRRLRRARLRMVLEAVEDFRRGWKGSDVALSKERVARGQLAIEHVMPRRWQANWPLSVGDSEEARDARIHTLGNLTLLTGRLNSKVSNGPWLGAEGKRDALNDHDVLVLNRDILKSAEIGWDDRSIKDRTETLANIVVQVWPVPKGHRSSFATKKHVVHKSVDLSDLIAAGLLKPGAVVFPRRKKFSDRVAILLPDGQLEVDGVAFRSPREAASAIAGKPTNGWWFFLTNKESKSSLRDVRQEYIASLALDTDDDDDDDDGDDDDDLSVSTTN